jgi:hypothetical protein
MAGWRLHHAKGQHVAWSLTIPTTCRHFELALIQLERCPSFWSRHLKLALIQLERRPSFWSQIVDYSIGTGQKQVEASVSLLIRSNYYTAPQLPTRVYVCGLLCKFCYRMKILRSHQEAIVSSKDRTLERKVHPPHFANPVSHRW